MRDLPERLSDDELARELQTLPDWQQHESTIERTVEFPTFAAAIRAVNAVAAVAEELNHHPDIDIRWRTLRLVLTTHDAGGLSTLDIEAARRIDEGVSRSV